MKLVNRWKYRFEIRKWIEILLTYKPPEEVLVPPNSRHPTFYQGPKCVHTCCRASLIESNYYSNSKPPRVPALKNSFWQPLQFPPFYKDSIWGSWKKLRIRWTLVTQIGLLRNFKLIENETNLVKALYKMLSFLKNQENVDFT